MATVKLIECTNRDNFTISVTEAIKEGYEVKGYDYTEDCYSAILISDKESAPVEEIRCKACTMLQWKILVCVGVVIMNLYVTILVLVVAKI